MAARGQGDVDGIGFVGHGVNKPFGLFNARREQRIIAGAIAFVIYIISGDQILYQFRTSLDYGEAENERKIIIEGEIPGPGYKSE